MRNCHKRIVLRAVNGTLNGQRDCKKKEEIVATLRRYYLVACKKHMYV